MLTTTEKPAFMVARGPDFTNPFSAPVKPDISTDWDYAVGEMRRSGRDHERHMAGWKGRRAKDYSEDDWTDTLHHFRKIEHRFLYKLTPAMIERTIVRSDHALGDVRGRELKEGEPLHRYTNFSPILPMILLLHWLLEDLGRMPTWQEFEAFIRAHPEYFLKPFAEKYRLRYSDLLCDWETAGPTRAIKFRLGAAYYSFVREVHMMAVLRCDFGKEFRYHVALDVEFKIDMSVDDVLIALFIRNLKYKTDDGGRKDRIEQLNPARTCIDIVVDEDKIIGGRPHLVSLENIARAVKQIEAAASGFPRR